MLNLSLIDTIRKVGTPNSKMPQGGVWEYCLLCLCLCLCVPNSQQKGPSYRFGVPVLSGGPLPWMPSQGHTSLASGLGTPMDPTLHVWKTKPHRYIPFRKTLSWLKAWIGVAHIILFVYNRVAKEEEPLVLEVSFLCKLCIPIAKLF